jgi:hypothetical protein
MRNETTEVNQSKWRMKNYNPGNFIKIPNQSDVVCEFGRINRAR